MFIIKKTIHMILIIIITKNIKINNQTIIKLLIQNKQKKMQMARKGICS